MFLSWLAMVKMFERVATFFLVKRNLDQVENETGEALLEFVLKSTATSAHLCARTRATSEG